MRPVIDQPADLQISRVWIDVVHVGRLGDHDLSSGPAPAGLVHQKLEESDLSKRETCYCRGIFGDLDGGEKPISDVHQRVGANAVGVLSRLVEGVDTGGMNQGVPHPSMAWFSALSTLIATSR